MHKVGIFSLPTFLLERCFFLCHMLKANLPYVNLCLHLILHGSMCCCQPVLLQGIIGLCFSSTSFHTFSTALLRNASWHRKWLTRRQILGFIHLKHAPAGNGLQHMLWQTLCYYTRLLLHEWIFHMWKRLVCSITIIHFHQFRGTGCKLCLFWFILLFLFCRRDAVRETKTRQKQVMWCAEVMYYWCFVLLLNIL